MKYRCWICKAEFKAYAPAERHMDTHGGGRLECLFEFRSAV